MKNRILIILSIAIGFLIIKSCKNFEGIIYFNAVSKAKKPKIVDSIEWINHNASKKIQSQENYYFKKGLKKIIKINSENDTVFEVYRDNKIYYLTKSSDSANVIFFKKDWDYNTVLKIEKLDTVYELYNNKYPCYKISRKVYDQEKCFLKPIKKHKNLSKSLKKTVPVYVNETFFGLNFEKNAYKIEKKRLNKKVYRVDTINKELIDIIM